MEMTPSEAFSMPVMLPKPKATALPRARRTEERDLKVEFNALMDMLLGGLIVAFTSTEPANKSNVTWSLVSPMPAAFAISDCTTASKASRNKTSPIRRV